MVKGFEGIAGQVSADTDDIARRTQRLDKRSMWRLNF